jgi:hypothetical protein
VLLLGIPSALRSQEIISLPLIGAGKEKEGIPVEFLHLLDEVTNFSPVPPLSGDSHSV